MIEIAINSVLIGMSRGYTLVNGIILFSSE